MTPLISIITVCLNSEKTIERTLQSVVKQTYSNIEYIIIDGKSTDKTLNIINKYKEIFREKMTVISEEDGGLYDAMNKGIRLAHGEMIALLNSDDWYEDNTIDSVMQKYETADTDTCIVYGMLRRIKDNSEHSIQFLHADFLETEGMCHSSCFISRKAYEISGLYDTHYRIASDFDLLIRMKRAGVKFIPVYSVLTNFLMGGTSSAYGILAELNEIKYRYHIISRRRYLWKRLKIILHL